VQRTEPAAALFTVPADYTVKEGGPGGPRIIGAGFTEVLEAARPQMHLLHLRACDFMIY